MIVFNLNALVAFGWTTYNGVRRKCIQKMTEHEIWEKLGRRFNRFEPDRGNDKPSEWYIVLYCILHLFAMLKRSNIPATTSEEDSKKDAILMESQNWKQWFQLPTKKPTREDRKGEDREGTVSGANPPEPV